MLDMLGRNELSLAMITCPPPNYTGGDRGFAAVPGLETRFQQDFRRTQRYAKALGARHIHIMSGVGAGPDALRTYLENLRWDCVQAVEIVKEVGAPNLGLQFDTCHAQQIHGDVFGVWSLVKDYVTHVQIAQSPGRKSPDQPGQIDTQAFVKQIVKDGYKGYARRDDAQRAGLGQLNTAGLAQQCAQHPKRHADHHAHFRSRLSM